MSASSVKPSHTQEKEEEEEAGEGEEGEEEDIVEDFHFSSDSDSS